VRKTNRQKENKNKTIKKKKENKTKIHPETKKEKGSHWHQRPFCFSHQSNTLFFLFLENLKKKLISLQPIQKQLNTKPTSNKNEFFVLVLLFLVLSFSLFPPFCTLWVCFNKWSFCS
jgi:hypothetical protein